MRDDFAVFILTNRRAGNVKTYQSLKRQGYTGKIYLMVDDEDPQRDAYESEFGLDEVVVFNKEAAVRMTDACDNYGKRNSVVFARNYCFIVARKMGLRYMLQLDDDYGQWWWGTEPSGRFITSKGAIKNLDPVFEACLSFMDESPVRSIAWAQGGDYIGGMHSSFLERGFGKPFSRKAMNTFFLRVNDDVTFRGRVNDDVNLYVEAGRRGDVFITTPRLRIYQPQTQAVAGGCTDVYKELGTYIKSFYSVLVAPACVKITLMGVSHKRIHHIVKWNNAVPKIIDEKHKKAK